jgi:hypothetical protein
MNGKLKCSKDKINYLATNSKNKNIRGINEFEWRFQPRNNFVRFEDHCHLGYFHGGNKDGCFFWGMKTCDSSKKNRRFGGIIGSKYRVKKL